MQPKILFLYTELAGYNIPCFQELIKNNCELLIIRYPVNPEAPFTFNEIKLTTKNKKEFSFRELIKMVEEFNPDIIYCSGWIDKDYLKICKQYKGKAHRVVGFDNQWKGSIKQHLACLMSFLKIKPYFDYAWVPGLLQEKFALKLGFQKNKILSGLYSADVSFFNQAYHSYKKLNKRFIYAGRYYAFKGIENLWQAFIQLQTEKPNDWELWCMGTGSINPIVHPKIKHLGFVQPKDILPILNQTDVFILPSIFEPWGVVVHEFAAAGFPIICSDKVGARHAFVKENVNGFIYEAENINQLKNLMEIIIDMSENEIKEMGKNSNTLAQNITPQTWTKSLLSVLNQ